MLSPNNVETGIVHFGIGRFHRAHEAVYVQELLSKGYNAWGLCGVCMLPYDKFIFESLNAQKGKYTLLEKDSKSETVKQIDSIKEVLYGHLDPKSVFDKLCSDKVKLITCTVTEAGYFFDPIRKNLLTNHEAIQHDFKNITKPKTLYGYLVHGIYLRHKAGLKPFTIQSCDNIQGNGTLLKRCLLEFCGVVYPSLTSYINENVTFPNSMVDRITPAATTHEVEYVQNTLGLSDLVPVTSEVYRQWVIEDNYCNDRPNWSEVGVQMTNSVKPYEKIKVRLLNGGHSALAYSGHLAGFVSVSEAATNEVFVGYLRKYFSQVQRTLLPVEGMDFLKYQESLLSRFGNTAIEDQLLRLCKDGSAKIPGFVLEALDELLRDNQPASCIAFLLASFIRFLEIMVEKNEKIDDPEAEKLMRLVKSSNGAVSVFLSDNLFGSLSNHTQFVSSVQDCYDDICTNGILNAMNRV